MVSSIAVRNSFGSLATGTLSSFNSPLYARIQISSATAQTTLCASISPGET